jgi:hypothetical protein
VRLLCVCVILRVGRDFATGKESYRLCKNDCETEEVARDKQTAVVTLMNGKININMVL